MLVDEIDVLDPDLYAKGDPADNGLPHALFDELRTHRPVHRQRLSDPALIDWTWVVSRHADVEYIAIHPDLRKFHVVEAEGRLRIGSRKICSLKGGDDDVGRIVKQNVV